MNFSDACFDQPLFDADNPFSPAQLWEQMATGVIAVDPGGTVRTVNGAAEKMFGKTRRHLLGISLEKLLPGHPLALDLVARARNLGMPCRVRNARIDPGPGIHLSVSLTAAPLIDDEGRPVGALLQLEEMGDVERLEAGDKLNETLDSLGNLALAVAHEVKNPLAGIRGAAQLLEMGPDADAACTELIRTEVDRVTRLLDALLGLADDTPGTEEALNIHEILDHVTRVCELTEPPLVRDYDPSLPTIRGNGDALVQLFMNLVKNAREAVAAGETITLHTRISNRVRFEQGRRRRHILVEVRDEGPGIAEGLKARIFQPFVTTKAKGEGTGLGLAICQKIVHDHGGLVEVESQPGNTVFRVFLPMPGS